METDSARKMIEDKIEREMQATFNTMDQFIAKFRETKHPLKTTNTP